MPFAENDDFVGRRDAIKSLTRLLPAKKSGRVALVGIGGVGKTQVALKISYWMKQNRLETSVFWMPAFSMASYEQTCTNLAKKLNLSCGQDDDVKELIQRHLSSETAGHWLLILDNADSEDVLYDGENSRGIAGYLPRNKYGQMLVTTRSRKVAVDTAKKNVILLKEMEPNEAKDLFQSSLISTSLIQDDVAIDNLLRILTYLPLAIAQAAAYLNIHELPIAEYLRLCRHSQQDMMELMQKGYHDDTLYDKSQSAVATTWLVSFQQIQKSNAASARLLFFLTWIEPQAIPRSILPDVGSEQEKTQALGTLQGYGFLSSRQDRGVFDMHGLVHMAMRLWACDQDTDGSMKKEVLVRLAEVFPLDEWENREVWRAYMPHALHAYWSYQEYEPRVASELGFWIGRCLYVDGQVKEAVTLLERVVKIHETILAEDHPSRLASQHALAGAYRANGQVKEAVTLLERVVKIRETILAEDHPSRLASQHVLAGTYRANGQVKEAVTILERVVKIRETILAEDHPSRLASQHELAGAYRANGQVKEAVTILERVVKIEETTLAEDHPDRLASQHALAIVFWNSGQAKEAVELLEHVVTIQKETLAENHPRRLVSEALFDEMK